MIQVIIAMLLAPMLFTTGAFSQSAGQLEPVVNVSFDDSAARYVLKNPAAALSNERDSIWNSFEGYRITLVWHEKSSVPVTWQIWERGLNRFIEDTSLTTKALNLADSLTVKANRERLSIAQHLSSYLSSKAPIDASVYFVAFTVPYAFCVEQNKIGIDITGDEWNFDTDCILNTTIHELYHVGFRLNTPDIKCLNDDPTDADSFVRFCYIYLQSEGMATYVGYRALDLFPSNYRHDDYKLLEDDLKVRKALTQIRTLVEDARTAPLDTLLTQAWDIGVSERAYYVAGAYMAKVIEEKQGREYLAGLVSRGGLSFIKAYNAIVADEYRVPLIEL